MTMSEIFTTSAAGTLPEVFCVGTAVVIITATCIVWQRCNNSDGGGVLGEVEVKVQTVDMQDVLLPVVGEEGSIAQTLWGWLVDIQEGRIEWEGWDVS